MSSPLGVFLPSLKPRDLVWVWGGECLVPESTLSLFQEAGFTGFEPIPVIVDGILRGPQTPIPQVWELKITGRAGRDQNVPGRRYGIRCPFCGIQKRRNTVPGIHIDPKKWDGSDFSVTDNYPSIILITERVKDFIISHKLKDCSIFPAEAYPMPTDPVWVNPKL